MSAKTWNERIREMCEALVWADNEEIEEPHKVVRGVGTRFYLAEHEGESAQGIDQYDAIRNLWQKLGRPES